MTQIARDGKLPPIYPIFVPQGRSKLRFKVGYIDRGGNLLIAPVFDDGTGFHGGLAAVQLKNKWGFIDASGSLKIEPRFASPGYFESGVATVATNRGYGVIDLAGNFVLPPNLHGLGSFSEGMACFLQRESTNGMRYGFINQHGQILVPAIFPHALGFSEGLAAVELDGLWGFIRPTGIFEIEPSYEGLRNAKGKLVLAGASSFREGLARVWTGNKNAYIDKTGHLRFMVDFDMAMPFSNGRAMVRRGENYGFIDTFGNLAINPSFSLCHDFCDGMSSVELAKKKLWGIIDRDGNWIIEPKFLYALAIKDGLCLVETQKTIGYINGAGEFVWQGPFVEYRRLGL
jgi:WG containing repeat